MTVLRFERHAVAADEVEAFTAVLTELLDAIRRQPGVLWADAARALDDDPSYILLSEWRTEPDLRAWEEGAEASELREHIESLERSDVTRRLFQTS